MNKVQGNKDSFALVRQDASRVIVSYGYEEIENTEYATWFEVYFYKKKVSQPDLDMVRNAILADIDSQTDDRILTGFTWEDNDGNEVMVWLSDEQQRNFSATVDLVKEHPEKLPKTFKLSDSEDRVPHFKTFTTYEALDEFHVAVFDFIDTTLQEGFQRKYTISWHDYQDALDVLFPPQPVVEPQTSAE